jgi:hypothetical protein
MSDGDDDQQILPIFEDLAPHTLVKLKEDIVLQHKE